ncbi:MAG: 50S ribosomal protein L25 [Planctomycetota bacterium]|jgi:large subunit ribosomal protein L25
MAVLKATKRTELGTRKVRLLRSQGRIPAIIYGHGRDPVPITLQEHDVELAVLHGERLLEVRLGKTKENVLIKDVQYDTFGHDILHVDLSRVSLDERVEVTVPIVLRGRPAGLAEGGVLQQLAGQVSIECLVTAIPEEIRVAVGEMKVGDLVYMSDLPLPEGAGLISDPESPVCSVTIVAEAEEVPVEEEAVAAEEPEIVGEEKEQAPEQAEEKQ